MAKSSISVIRTYEKSYNLVFLKNFIGTKCDLVDECEVPSDDVQKFTDKIGA